MWVDLDEDELSDEVLDELRVALAPPAGVPRFPTRSEIDHLHQVVAARYRSAPAAGAVVPLRRGTSRRVGRVGAAAAAIVVFAGSAAAAATGGMGLPRPVRAVAHAIGLPVDSPALDEAHQHLRALDAALDARDAEVAEEALRRLGEAVSRMPDDERDDVRDDVEEALAEAAPLLAQTGWDEPHAVAATGVADPESPAAPIPATSPGPRPSTSPASASLPSTANGASEGGAVDPSDGDVSPDGGSPPSDGEASEEVEPPGSSVPSDPEMPSSGAETPSDPEPEPPAAPDDGSTEAASASPASTDDPVPVSDGTTAAAP